MVYGDGIYGAGIYGLAGTITPALPRPTILLYPNVTVELDGDAYQVTEDTEITLDAGAVPYASASVHLPLALLDESILDLLDPRAGDVRCPVTGSDSLVGAPREFDLGLREREINHVAKTVTLHLAGDEALLMDYAPLVDDPTPRTLETSLRDVCDYVLDKIDAALEAGAADDDLTAYWQVKNLIPNPNCRVDTAGWGTTIVGGGTGVLSRQVLHESIVPDGQSPGYRARLLMSSNSDDLTLLRYGTGSTNNVKGFQPGRRYWVTGWLYQNSGAPKTQYVWVGWKDDANVTLKSDPREGGTIPHDEWTRFAVSFVAPAAGTTAAIEVGIADGMPNGTQVSVTGLMFCESEFDPGRWFDGARTADFGYTYAYDGDALASASVRIPDVERSPESLVWAAGQTAWDFLSVLCASAGLVLWADEQRRWYLQTPESRTVPVLLSITASMVSESTDILSREDTETFVTGVVCRFFWEDADGISHTRVDSAGAPGKVLVREFQKTPFPGPGIAAAMLARRSGTGRKQPLTARTRWDATPGMTANISLPAAPETTARISAVTFRTNGFMELVHAGVVDLIPGTIAALVGTIDGLTGTIDDL